MLRIAYFPSDIGVSFQRRRNNMCDKSGKNDTSSSYFPERNTSRAASKSACKDRRVCHLFWLGLVPTIAAYSHLLTSFFSFPDLSLSKFKV